MKNKKIILILLIFLSFTACNNINKENEEEKPVVKEDTVKQLHADNFKINGDDLKFPLIVKDLQDLGYVAKYPRYNYAFTEIYTKQLTELSFDRGESEHITGFVYAKVEDGPAKAKIKDILIKKDDNTKLNIEGIKYDMSKQETIDMLNEYDNIKDKVDEDNALKFTINDTIIELTFNDDKLYSIKLTDKTLEEEGY
jgi:lipoprotein